MIYLTLFLILSVALAMGTFAGLLVSANTPFGEFSFSEPRKDVIRSLIVGIVTAGVCIGLMAITRNPRALVALIPVWYITVKLCWLDMEMVDFFVLALTSFTFLAVAALVARKLFS